MKGMRKWLLIIGPFPPPVHGFSVITAAMADEIARLRPVLRCNLASRKSGMRRQLAQVGLCLRAMARVAWFRLRGGHEISLGANAGAGMIFTLTILAVARLSGARILLHHHSYAYITRRSPLMAVLSALGGARLEHVFLAQDMQSAFFARYLQRAPSHVLPNAMFVPAQPARSSVRAGPIRVGLLSNLSHEKGLYDFIETAQQVRSAALPIEMRLAGPVPCPEDAQAVRTAEAEGVVSALGPLYGPDKEGFFCDLDLFLFPSRYANEAQPTVIYEAFAAGVPVLATARGAIAEQIGDCLGTVANADAFAAEATALCARLCAEDEAGRSALRTQTRARYEAAAQEGRAALARIYRPKA